MKILLLRWRCLQVYLGSISNLLQTHDGGFNFQSLQFKDGSSSPKVQLREHTKNAMTARRNGNNKMRGESDSVTSQSLDVQI